MKLNGGGLDQNEETESDTGVDPDLHGTGIHGTDRFCCSAL